jgi:hypothetical protein
MRYKGLNLGGTTMLSSLADGSFFIPFFVEEDKSSLVISKKLKLVKED